MGYGTSSPLSGFISVLISYLLAAETEPPLLSIENITAVYSTGKSETVNDIVTLGLVLASGKVQSEGVHKYCTFQHCFLFFTYVIFSFPLSFSSTCKCCVCSHGCFMYCIASEVLTQNTCKTEPIMLSFFYGSLLSLFPF